MTNNGPDGRACLTCRFFARDILEAPIAGHCLDLAKGVHDAKGWCHLVVLEHFWCWAHQTQAEHDRSLREYEPAEGFLAEAKNTLKSTCELVDAPSNVVDFGERQRRALAARRK